MRVIDATVAPAACGDPVNERFRASDVAVVDGVIAGLVIENDHLTGVRLNNDLVEDDVANAAASA